MTRLSSIAVAIICAFTFFLSGCASSDYAQSPGQKQIEIFRDGAKPPTAFKEIGMLTDNGSLGEQGQIESKFLKKARKAGADAIIMHPQTQIGGELKGFGIVDTYLFKATMIVFQR
jgi:hypothetical protein